MKRNQPITKVISVLICASYLASCIGTQDPSSDEGSLLGSIGAHEGKADGPDAVKDWRVKVRGGKLLNVVGVDANGGQLVQFIIRPIDLQDEAGVMTATGISVAATFPEGGYREVTTAGEVKIDTMSPRLNALLEQLQGDVDAQKAKEPEGGGKGDLSDTCTGSLAFLVATAVSALLCPLTGLTCFIGLGAAAATAVSGLLCLISLAID